MTNNHNLPYENEGVDIVGYNPQITKDYLQQEHSSLGAPVDDGRPGLNVEEYAPGEIISDQYFNYSNNGIHQVTSASTNSTDEWERQVKAADLEATRGRTIYNNFVVNSKSVMPNIVEPPKPTQEQLAQVHKEAQINSLTQKLRRLNDEEGALQLRLVGIEIARKKAKDELGKLESN